MKMYKTSYSIVIFGYPAFLLYFIIIIMISISFHIQKRASREGYYAVAGPGTCWGKLGAWRNAATVGALK